MCDSVCSSTYMSGYAHSSRWPRRTHPSTEHQLANRDSKKLNAARCAAVSHSRSSYGTQRSFAASICNVCRYDRLVKYRMAQFLAELDRDLGMCGRSGCASRMRFVPISVADWLLFVVVCTRYTNRAFVGAYILRCRHSTHSALL